MRFDCCGLKKKKNKDRKNGYYVRVHKIGSQRWRGNENAFWQNFYDHIQFQYESFYYDSY